MNRIDEVLSYFTNEEKFSNNHIKERAGYWKIGTSIFNTFDRLRENIIYLDISKPIISKFDEDFSRKKDKQNTYNLWLNGSKITPCNRKENNKYASIGAIGQYKDMIRSFGIGFISKEINDKNFAKKGQIMLASNAINLLDTNNRINLIKKVIIDGIYSNVKDTRNIAYSIIIELLFAYEYDFSNLESVNRVFRFRKSPGKINKKIANKEWRLDEIHEKEYVQKDILNQGTKATYKEIVETIKNKYSSLEDFFDEIYIDWKGIEDGDDSIIYEFISKNIKTNNINDYVSLERSKFKKNIFEDRKSKSLINSTNDSYSDLVDMNGQQLLLLSKWNESEACHIFEVHKAKNILLNNSDNNEEILKSISDPNNGLMMNSEYHKSFDRGQWAFDLNGNMLIDEENEEYLFKERGLKRIKINPKVFNNEMREYIKRR